MPKLVFLFAGTDESAFEFKLYMERINFGYDVVRVYLHGCEHKDIGGGMIFPDLNIVAQKIRNAFDNNKTIDLDSLQAQFSSGVNSGIAYIENPHWENNFTPESIGLYGFSRGAVTCFALARMLNDLHIPIDIIANQPVPGQMNEVSPRSLYDRYHDLTDCLNIRSATTLLASHYLEGGFLHNSFFSQMVAKFSPSTHVNNWIMPHQTHLVWQRHELVFLHIQQQFSKQGGYVSGKYDNSSIIQEYTSKRDELYFTPRQFSQIIYGHDQVVVSKDPVYLAMINRQAQQYIQKTDALFDTSTLTEDQACAIVALSETATLSTEDKETLSHCLAQENQQSNKLTQIILNVSATIEYLVHAVDDGVSAKSSLMKTHANAYKKDVFVSCYDYIIKNNPTADESQQFIQSIYNAQQAFEQHALELDRGWARQVMKVITNGILLISVVGLIANVVNKAITGEWHLLNHTRSTNTMRAALKEIKALTVTKDPNVQSITEIELDVLPSRSIKR